MTTAAEMLKGKGIQPSMQRITIAKYLMEHRDHPSAEEIYIRLSAGMPTLSKATVYNTLNIFSRKNVVKVILTPEGERRYDIFTGPHAHSVCPLCGALEDIGLTGEEIRLLDGIAMKAGSEGFTLMLSRACRECRKTT